MKQFVLFFFLTLSLSSNMLGQNLTKTEANIFADQLFTKEILSIKGRDILKNAIANYNFGRDLRPDLIDGSYPSTSKLSIAQLLRFCSQAFEGDFLYRSGITVQDEVIKKLRKEGKINLNPQTEEEMEQLQLQIEEKLKEFKGYQLEEKIAWQDSPPENFGFTINPLLMPGNSSQEYNLIHHKTSVLGKTRTKVLNVLKAIGMINDQIFQETLAKIESNELYLEYLVFAYAVSRVAYFEDYSENKAKELEYLAHLVKHNLLSKGKHEKLVDSYKAFELKGKFEILRFCNNAIFFRRADLSKNPNIAYPQIFSSIKKIISDFNFQNFSFSTSESSTLYDTSYIEQYATIQFDVNDIKYASSFFFNTFNKNDSDSLKNEWFIGDDEKFVVGINKYLADQNSPQRLYYVYKRFTDPTMNSQQLLDEFEFGLILMNESQYTALRNSIIEFVISEPNHDNRFNTKGIKFYLTECERIGLFSHLSAEELEKGKKIVGKKSINSLLSILSCFPRIIASIDWESAYGEAPYARLLSTYAHISRGAFKPVNVIDQFKYDHDTNKTPFSFELNGKKYQEYMNYQGDWFDITEFDDMLDRALRDNNVDEKYYYLSDKFEEGTIFLNSKQYNFIKKEQPSLFPENTSE